MNDKGKREDLCRTTSTGSAEKIKAEFQNWMNNTCNCSSNLLDPNISMKMSWLLETGLQMKYSVIILRDS